MKLPYLTWLDIRIKDFFDARQILEELATDDLFNKNFPPYLQSYKEIHIGVGGSFTLRYILIILVNLTILNTTTIFLSLKT